MLLPDRDGIACDFCANRYKKKFVYFSLKATEHRVVGNQRLIGTDPKFAKDMCVSCYDSLVEEVIQFIGPTKRGMIKDDLSKDYGTGDFLYWIVTFDKVEVDGDQPEGNQINVEKRVLDLNLVNFRKFKKRTEKIEAKLKKTGAWA